MRILRISHSAVVTTWRHRERELARRGHCLRTLAAERWNEGGSLVTVVPQSGEDVLGVRTVGSHPALFLYEPWPLWRALGERWDVLDLHEEPFALCTAEILVLRRLHRQRAPYTLYSAQNISKHYPPPFGWLQRWSLRHAAGLSVCSAQAGRICQDHGFPGRPRVIPLGFDPTEFNPIGRAEPDENRVIVGYAGRLAEYKGVSVLLRAIAGDARLELRLAGAGPHRTELVDEASRLGISERVRFLGGLTDEQLPDFYRSLDVLAVPSLTTRGWMEQFGRVALEAMACGTPVVASDSGALSEVVGGVGLLAPPGDHAALARALVRVGTDPALADRLRTAGLRRAAQCTWAQVACDYERMYAQAVHRPVPTDPTRPSVTPRPLEVVVVAYGAPTLVRRAIAPLADLPLTVVDNSSMPEIAAVASDLGVRYLDPGHNTGFAAGVNAVLHDRLVPGADVLLLNPDAEVAPGDVRELQQALLADPDLAAVGPVQMDAGGTASKVVWPFPSPARAWLEAIGFGRYQPERARFVIGSVLLLRAEALAQVGDFDERFFLYAEETDWQYRAHLMGWRSAVVAQTHALHVGAATSTDTVRREAHFYGSQEKYLRKHYGACGWQVARTAQLVGSGVRSLLVPGRGGAAAAARLHLYWRGPMDAERAYLDREPA